MNSVNTNTRMSPSMAIVVYNDRHRQNFFLEKREIQMVGDKPTLMAPVALSDDTLKDIAKVYMKTRSAEMGFGGLIAPHLLFTLNKVGKTVVVWYRPAMKRTLNFSASLQIKGSSAVEVPATLYAVMNKTLYVFALQSSDRPDHKTKLYNAPFFNIYVDGNVCLGTARVGSRERTFEKEADRFERAFFLAEQNGGQSEKNCKTPLRTLWTQLIKTKAPFPSKKELIQHPKYKTLGDLITMLAGNNLSNDDDYEEEY